MFLILVSNMLGSLIVILNIQLGYMSSILVFNMLGSLIVKLNVH